MNIAVALCLLSSSLLLLVSACDIATTCVTDLSAEDCAPGFYFIQQSAVFDCCPGCQIRADVGEPCNENVPCLDGLTCLGNVICVDTGGGGVTPQPDPGENSGPCAPPTSGTYPICLPDGTYAAVQCKGDDFTGRCFCTDANGDRIFGQMWRSEAAEMTCACSRRRAELAATRSDVSLHCTPSGHYEPLQCDAGICWCAEPRSGQLTSLPVAEADVHLLPCYSAMATGAQYLRRCESYAHALSLIRKEQSEHGTVFFGGSTTLCDYDGSYGAYQITNSQAYCTGRTGSILGAWQASVGIDTADMNCNCALDTMVHFPEQGLSVSQACLGNGNYQQYQVSGTFHYCVDSDGYPTTDYVGFDTPLYCQN